NNTADGATEIVVEPIVTLPHTETAQQKIQAEATIPATVHDTQELHNNNTADADIDGEAEILPVAADARSSPIPTSVEGDHGTEDVTVPIQQ
ncbi:hypothetical protein A2U01_0069623, partial [Trifolium medium]|nr:hypothetical protein [Trifolium medium]